MAKGPPLPTLIHATQPLSGGHGIFRLLPAACVSVVVHAFLVALLVFVLDAPGSGRPQLERVERPLQARTIRAADLDRPDMPTPDFTASVPGSRANYKSPIKAEVSVPEVADPLQRPGVKDGAKEKEPADIPKSLGFKTNRPGSSPLPEQPGSEAPSGAGLPTGLDPAAIEKWAGGPFGRSGSQRAEALSSFGGGNESEVAVNRGLEFLKRTQQPNGSWKVIHASFPAEERLKYTTPTVGDDIPPTALALLAFLSRGSTEEDKINVMGGLIDNPYPEVVKRAVKHLADQVNSKSSPLARADKQETYEYYGLVTLALCELYIMTRDEARKERLKPIIEIAVRQLKERQMPSGGWSHQNGAKGEGHIIPTGWAIQALRTAQMAGFVSADDQVLAKAKLFVESLLDPKTQGYRYTRGRNPEYIPTVVGLLNRMHLGGATANYSSLAAGVDNYVFSVGADYKDPKWAVDDGERQKVFYWFYGTQAMFHLGGDQWKAWNYWMRDYFLRQHVQAAGSSSEDLLAGSWAPVETGDTSELIGGRMLRTCLAILTLEIYYRQVPLHLRNLALGSK